MFNERKVAQMAAYLLAKDGGRFAHLKLMKLLYLSDRESMNLSGFSISGDYPVSMRHGPVLSLTLSLISGDVLSQPDGWDCWISDKENHEVAVKREFNRNELDELSEFDIDIMDIIWDNYGHMTQWEIRDFTHDNCAEWIDPKASSSPIPEDRIFKALGKSDEQVKALSSEIENQKSIHKLFAAL